MNVNALLFIEDPGHGWLRAPLVAIAALGIENEISACSFIDDRFAYLEEDCDYAVFIGACSSQGVALPAIENRYVDRFNRNRPRFGDPQFSPAFWNSLRS